MSVTVMETWSSIASPSRASGRLLQPLQRFLQLCLSRHCGFALFFLFFDDLFRRVGDEFFVGELGVDALDVAVGFADLLLKPRPLGGKINHALERKRGDFA